jgi:hypothetical protein
MANDKPEGYTTGRPTSYRPEMCEVMMNVMSEGGSIVAVCAELDICRETFYNWIDPENPYFQREFFDTYKRAKVMSQAWWEKQGNKGIWAGKAFNGNVWEANMRNRFRDDWNPVNKTEHSGSIAAPVIMDDIDSGEE